MAYKDMRFWIEGTAPLVMHNGRMADPLYEGSKRLKEITAKRKKTDADLEQPAKLEFVYSLYLGDNGAPVIPQHVLRGCLVAAAKRLREGPQAKAGIYLGADAQLDYEGPRDAERLYQLKQFVFRSIESVNSNKVVRPRPRFDAWSATFSLQVDDELLGERAVEEIVQTAGRVVGLGERRPTFGRFSAKRTA